MSKLIDTYLKLDAWRALRGEDPSVEVYGLETSGSIGDGKTKVPLEEMENLDDWNAFAMELESSKGSTELHFEMIDDNAESVVQHFNRYAKKYFRDDDLTIGKHDWSTELADIHFDAEDEAFLPGLDINVVVENEGTDQTITYEIAHSGEGFEELYGERVVDYISAEATRDVVIDQVRDSLENLDDRHDPTVLKPPHYPVNTEADYQNDLEMIVSSGVGNIRGIMDVTEYTTVDKDNGF